MLSTRLSFGGTDIANSQPNPGKGHRPSEGHRRTRDDHSRETAEDYVEAIAEIRTEKGKCRVVDLARRFAISHVTVTKTIGRLVREGLVTTEPYGPLELTPKGTRLATKARKRHEVVYSFLRAIGVSERTAAIDAEGIEHHVSPETLEKIEALTHTLSGPGDAE